MAVYSGEYCGIVNFPVAGWGSVSIWELFQTTQNPSGRDVISLSQHRINLVQCFRGSVCAFQLIHDHIDVQLKHKCYKQAIEVINHALNTVHVV